MLGSVGKAMSPLSMAIVGPLSDRWGVQWWYVVTGVMCVVFGLASLSMPSLLNLGSAGSGQEAIAEEQVEPAPTTQ